VDLTGISPFVGLGVRTFTAGHAALKAASRRKCVLTINMLLYYLFLAFSAS